MAGQLVATCRKHGRTPQSDVSARLVGCARGVGGAGRACAGCRDRSRRGGVCAIGWWLVPSGVRYGGSTDWIYRFIILGDDIYIVLIFIIYGDGSEVYHLHSTV
jgi:hypothetical protein